MAYKLLVEPAIEPITLADAKQHLRMEVSDDDALITLLIAAARQYAEQLTRTSFITQQWSLVLDAFPGPSLMGVPAGLPWSLPGHALLLEHGPVQSIDSITYMDMASAVQTMPSANYIADMTGLLARVTPKFGQIWPITLPQIASVSVNFTAGYGTTADKVPAGLVQWMKLRIGTLYENREEVVTGRGITVTPMPFIDGLLDPYRLVRF